MANLVVQQPGESLTSERIINIFEHIATSAPVFTPTAEDFDVPQLRPLLNVYGRGKGAGEASAVGQVLYNRGNSLKELKRHKEALESYDRALVLQPDFAEALNNRGSTLHELNRLLRGIAGALVVKPGNYREIPPIFRHFAAFEIGDLAKPSFRRSFKCLHCGGVIRLPNSVCYDRN